MHFPIYLEKTFPNYNYNFTDGFPHTKSDRECDALPYLLEF